MLVMSGKEPKGKIKYDKYLILLLGTYAAVILAAIIVGSLINSADACEIVVPENQKGTDFDCAIEFNEMNPDFCVVARSSRHLFDADVQFINCKLSPEGYLLVVDQYNGEYYIFENWENSDYYHFWFDEKPMRSFKYLTDNRLDFMDYNVANFDELT